MLFIFLIGCSDDNFPQGLYDYQVERLLSAGENKTWLLVSSNEGGVASFPTTCADSTRLFVTLIDQDSISISRLLPNPSCSAFDTLKLGNANASGDLLFTDSLRFATGRFWTIQSVTASEIEVFTTSLKLETFHSQ